MARSYERSGKAEIPGWLLEELLDALEKTELGFQVIADRAADYVGRKSGWDSSIVSNFRGGRSRTWEMAVGLCHVFGLPQPRFEARTLKEAIRLQAVAREFDDEEPRNAAITGAKRTTTLQRLDALVKDRQDQTAAVPSDDERGARSRRVRRSTHGR